MKKLMLWLMLFGVMTIGSSYAFSIPSWGNVGNSNHNRNVEHKQYNYGKGSVKIAEKMNSVYKNANNVTAVTKKTVNTQPLSGIGNTYLKAINLTDNGRKKTPNVLLDGTDGYVIVKKLCFGDKNHCFDYNDIITSMVLNGKPGTANGKYFRTAPTKNLCSVGNPTKVNYSNGKYTWTCTGYNGGLAVNGSAWKIIDGICGNNTSNKKNKADGWCADGIMVGMKTYRGLTSWTCKGGNRGASNKCSFNTYTTLCNKTNYKQRKDPHHICDIQITKKTTYTRRRSYKKRYFGVAYRMTGKRRNKSDCEIYSADHKDERGSCALNYDVAGIPKITSIKKYIWRYKK